jgi:hypothetical protein
VAGPVASSSLALAKAASASAVLPIVSRAILYMEVASRKRIREDADNVGVKKTLLPGRILHYRPKTREEAV